MTTKSIDVTRLVAELRKRFGSARNLCRALGVDERLLKPGKIALDEEIPQAPTGNAASALRLELEKLLAGYEEGDLPEGLAERFFEALRKHLPLRGDQEPERSIMRSGEVDRGAEAEELRRREEHGPEALDAESFSEFLRGKGVDEETISGAMKLVGDAFPPNALPHGGALGRGAGPGAKFAARRVGMDERLNKKFGIRLPDVGAAAADHAIDRWPVPSAARLEKTFAKFPGMAAIGVHGGS